MIHNSNFRLKEIPNFHPELEYYDRVSFWKEEKRKCIEGYWVGGKWMPGPLYYYINFHNIQHLFIITQSIVLWRITFIFCRSLKEFNNEISEIFWSFIATWN